MNDNDIQSLGLVDFLKDALDSTLLADADSVETLQEAVKEYSDESLEFIVPDSEGKDHIVKIPKLVIAPLPLLRIQEANFEVKGELEIQQGKTNTQNLTPALRRDLLRKSIRLVSSKTSTTDTKKTTLNVTINVKMSQADVPAGLTNLLQIAANNMQVK